jgi:hypothetical protein
VQGLGAKTGSLRNRQTGTAAVEGKRPSRIPRSVAWLGYGGLIPFLALAVLASVDRGRLPMWHGYLRAYGAVILSFVGALHWGFAMVLGNISAHQRNAMLGWSVIPCLLAFAALVANSDLGDVLLACGFAVHYLQDRRLAAVCAMPPWYLALRLRLSAVAVICVVAGAFSAIG